MANSPKIKPSAAGIWIGLVLMLLSLVSCGGGIYLAGTEVADAADKADRIPVPSSQTYNFEADAAGVIIGFGPTGSLIDVQLTDPDGNTIVLDEASTLSTSSDSSGDSIELLGAFQTADAGEYTLTSTGPTGHDVAIINISISSIVTKAFGGIGIGFLLFLIGFIWMIVTIVRRGRAKKKMTQGGYGQPPMQGGYPAPGMAPGMAPPGAPGFGAPPMAPPMAPPGAPTAPSYAPPAAPAAPNYPAPQAPAYPAPQAPAYPAPPAPDQPPAFGTPDQPPAFGAPAAPQPPAFGAPADPAPAAPESGGDVPPPPTQWGTDTTPPPPPFGS